jgi:hypothetical protein
MTFKVVGRRGGWGQKVLSRPSADSFAVGRREKVCVQPLRLGRLYLHVHEDLLMASNRHLLYIYESKMLNLTESKFSKSALSLRHHILSPHSPDQIGF